jgi:hypothetical protein
MSTSLTSSSDNLFEEDQCDAMSQEENQCNTLLLEKARYNAMQKILERNKHTILLAAINAFPVVILKALMISDKMWLEKFISSRFEMDLNKQMMHEIGVLEGTIWEDERSSGDNSIPAA